MNTDSAINLISPRAKLPDSVVRVSESLARISLVSLASFFAVSVLVGFSHWALNSTVTALSVRREKLAREVTTFAQTETLLVSLRDRVKLAEKILGSQVPWVETLERVNGFAPSPMLASVSVDEKRRVVLTIRASTLEENFPLLTALVAQVEAKRIIAPEVVSFALDKDGITRLVISFFPVL